MSQYTTIVTETRGRVGWVTLHRPEALNALGSTLVAELADAVVAFDRDDAIGAIVITGSERAFAAGADIKEMAGRSVRDMSVDSPFAALEEVSRVRTPLVAAVAGYALGGGCELAMMCDIVLAADTAVFGQPEIDLGVIPGIGGTQRLARAIGYYKAAEMVLTGRRMPADEAERAGLVSRVVPAADLLAEAGEVADRIASRSLPVVYAAKQALRASQETTTAEGLRLERTLFASLFALDDQTEGMAAFVEKRKPQFRHR
ncbi:enoyl-CoA hydratase-related protein [Microbacterium oleivorans]|uniref:Probable enoyl-CoA hydratase echA8 n=1 Tax=Microbacterium oleivorans TaxID=273677 RepID=A0A7D5EXZ3_9MICO|nr:enoyl-CoA hydratase-related protein [Microbacterium oleivorans]QLD11508.1 enoyl-CoA hydratase/isomerase family protein [Microbacterium oleivorans]